MSRILIVLLWFAASAGVAAEPHFYLLSYTPGASFDAALPYDQQPGMRPHEEYVRQLHDRETVIMSGTLANEPGELVIVRVDAEDQARRIASEDPAVMSRLLQVDVKGWRLELSSMRRFKRPLPEMRDPDAPFQVERLDPGSPINLKR